MIQTCKDRKIPTTAVYTTPYQLTAHVFMANDAVHIGEAPPVESYLNMEKIIAAALKTGANGVHPGWGYLSENAKFARMVQDSGLIWIGPSPEVIQKMGEKVEFEYQGVPYSIERVSIGSEHDGVIHAVMKVKNQIRVFKIETPRARKTEIRMAKGMTDIGAPINGTVWSIGNRDRGQVRAGDIVHKGEEIANLEAMKMENSIFAPYDAQITEITIRLNKMVKQEQLLFVLEEVKKQD